MGSKSFDESTVSSLLTELSAEESAAEARKLINSSASAIVFVVEPKPKKSMFSLFSFKKRLRKLYLTKIESAAEVSSKCSSTTNSLATNDDFDDYEEESDAEINNCRSNRLESRVTEENMEDILDENDDV